MVICTRAASTIEKSLQKGEKNNFIIIYRVKKKCVDKVEFIILFFKKWHFFNIN